MNVSMWLEGGVSVDVINMRGNTAMDIAACEGQDKIVMLLLDGMIQYE